MVGCVVSLPWLQVAERRDDDDDEKRRGEMKRGDRCQELLITYVPSQMKDIMMGYYRCLM